MCGVFIAIVGGFDRVFPMQRLQMFSAYELRLLVCGEQTPNWTREDIVNFSEPKFGYTRDRSVIIDCQCVSGGGGGGGYC